MITLCDSLWSFLEPRFAQLTGLLISAVCTLKPLHLWPLLHLFDLNLSSATAGYINMRVTCGNIQADILPETRENERVDTSMLRKSHGVVCEVCF